jgi:trans-aconitate methyltransferase
MENFYRLFRLFRMLFKREITLKQAYLMIRQKIVHRQRELNDDFDWTSYHLHYKEELKVISRTHTLVLQKGDFSWSNGKLVAEKKNLLPLHPNHELLYSLICSLAPQSVLEVGCGGGDHLSNLACLRPGMQIYGIDRSQEQLETLRQRHPQLESSTGLKLSVGDVTEESTSLVPADVVYSQAVLMHISETNGRFDQALRHMMSAAVHQLVMVENWTEHYFERHIRSALQTLPGWQEGRLYYSIHPKHADVSALIVSKTPLNLSELSNYEQVLQGRAMKIH